MIKGPNIDQLFLMFVLLTHFSLESVVFHHKEVLFEKISFAKNLPITSSIFFFCVLIIKNDKNSSSYLSS